MFQFISGLILGVGVGTHYNCKPTIDNITKYIQENIPKPKSFIYFFVLFFSILLFFFSILFILFISSFSIVVINIEYDCDMIDIIK